MLCENVVRGFRRRAKYAHMRREYGLYPLVERLSKCATTMLSIVLIENGRVFRVDFATNVIILVPFTTAGDQRRPNLSIP